MQPELKLAVDEILPPCWHGVVRQAKQLAGKPERKGQQVLRKPAVAKGKVLKQQELMHEFSQTEHRRPQHCLLSVLFASDALPVATGTLKKNRFKNSSQKNNYQNHNTNNNNNYNQKYNFIDTNNNKNNNNNNYNFCSN
eukprot:4172615-Amphidinium_carterae.1